LKEWTETKLSTLPLMVIVNSQIRKTAFDNGWTRDLFKPAGWVPSRAPESLTIIDT